MNTINNFDLTEIARSINARMEEAYGVEGAKAKGVFSATEKGLEITFTDETGAATSVPLALPELDAPEGAGFSGAEVAALLEKLESGDVLLDQETLTKAKALLDDIAAKLKAADNADTQETKESGGVSNVFVDIYQLIALLADCARTQKEAGRAARQSAATAQLEAIENQAKAQETAALTGLISALCVGALQATVMAVSSVKQMSAISETNDVAKEHGVNTRQRMMENTALQNDPKLAKQSLENTQSKLGITNERATEIRNEITGGEKVTAAHDKFTGAAHGKAEVLENAKAENKEPNAEALQAKNDSLDAARDEIRAGLDERVELYEAKLTQAEMTGDKAKIATAQKELEYANAVRTEYLSQSVSGERISTEASATADYAKAKSRFGEAQGAARSDDRTHALELKGMKWKMVSEANTILGGALQSVVQGAEKYMEADATRLAGEQKKAEMERDTAGDTIENAKELEQKVLQLLEAIGQAETEPHRAIIGV